MPPSPVVELEDRIGSQLLLAQLGVGPTPYLEPRYDVVELRGRGARGVVCRARDRTLARDVALKLYPPLTDAQLPKEVAREAQALARLDHPNVVRVHDVGAAALVAGTERLACLYLSMEFIEGRSLRAWRSERKRPRAEILRVLLAAGEGLAAAHDGGMIHRDFKPENVMLEPGPEL
jgi:serine/threonine protein kinase